MTYLEFLIFFIGIPLLAFTLWAYRKQCLRREKFVGIGLMGMIALVYTTPWDNYLIEQNIWSYPEGVVLGTIGFVPIEEYGFMVLQTVFAGILWCFISHNIPASKLCFSGKGVAAAVIIGLIGACCLLDGSGTYAGLIFVWAFPPLAIQWGLGARALLSSFKKWGPLWVGFTLYLCLADAVAIADGIWMITEATRSGIEIGNLPIEEILFFGLTNLFVFQGLCLWQVWRNKV
jgi:lycopene cyclase domain-containing protein